MGEMMKLYLDYYNQIFVMNDTTRKLFVTGVLESSVERFRDRISQDKKSQSTNILKFFFYSDHDDAIVSIAKVFDYQLPIYPPLGSQIIYELWKIQGKYYVNLTINEVQVPLPGACRGQYLCEFSTYIELIKSISYYGNPNEYNKLCERSPLE